jgi:hypothetical protein
MNVTQITKAQTRAQIPFEAAKQIREILDKARKEYGGEGYDVDGIEDQILELVTGEE